MSKMDLAIIDYKKGNIFSLVNVLDHFGYRCKIMADENDILQVDGAMLSGVGTFPEAMQYPVGLALTEVVREIFSTGKLPADK